LSEQARRIRQFMMSTDDDFGGAGGTRLFRNISMLAE
jgi:hypothetical protein